MHPLWPTTVVEAQEQLDAYRAWYSRERPHQGRACGNRPPTDVFPMPVLPAIPAMVDADGWLHQIDGWTYVRRANARGEISLDGVIYGVGSAYAKQELAVQVDAPQRELVFRYREQVIKRAQLKRLLGGMMSFDHMITALCGLADRETQRLMQRQQRSRR